MYAWSAFTSKLTADPFAFTKTETQVIFSVGLVTFAVVMALIAGKWQKKVGPKIVAMTGGIVLGVGYVMAGLAGNNFWGILLGVGVLGGAGIGLAYVCPIAALVKWFPDKKGFITGLAVAGFGFGALIWIKLTSGFKFGPVNLSPGWNGLYGMGWTVSQVFVLYGILFAFLVAIGAMVMVNPPEGWKPEGWNPPTGSTAASTGGVDFTVTQMARTSQFSILFLTFLTVSVPLQSESRYEKMDEYLNLANELWRFNGTVLVADRGEILLCRGYGFSNKDFGQPNTPQTRFFIGSITKQFTAAAILALRDDSVLNLDSPIIDYLPDYPPVPGRLITIRHLLTHTSGIPNYTDDPEIVLMRTEPLAPDDIIDLFRNRPLKFAPGTSFQYSNSGYILLGKIIEVASGQSYEAFLHRRILKPAGMLSTGYGRRESGIPDWAARSRICALSGPSSMGVVS